jgi:hypothetical protein
MGELVGDVIEREPRLTFPYCARDGNAMGET